MLIRSQPQHESLLDSLRRGARGARCRALTSCMLLALLATCSSQAPGPAVEVDCRSVDENYDLSVWQPFDDADMLQWYGVSDFTPGAMVGVDVTGGTVVEHNPVVEPIEDVPELGAQEDGRCGSTFALVLRAAEFRDWGAFFSEYFVAQAMFTGLDTSGGPYDGFSFWARSAPGTDRSFTFVIDNWDTAGFRIDGETPDPYATDCVAKISEEVSPGVYEETDVYPEGTDPKDTCGNSFKKIIETSDTWRFYTIPWADFLQDIQANREPGGLDPEQRILRLQFRFTSDTRNELWIDDIGLYRALPR